MAKSYLGQDVFSKALDRLMKCYSEGHRMIISFSGGKDSGVLFELAYLAAEATGNLPVEVVMRDDEIMYPGTFEYAERIARRPNVNFHWISARQGQINIFNRENPFFWVFDPYLDPSQWVREPPYDLIEWDLENTDMYTMVNPTKYEPPPKKKTVSVVGIRTQESQNRNFAILSSRGSRSYASKDKRMFMLYPIYDWTTGDIWKAINDNKWDYNEAYDVLMKMGVAPDKQRIALIAMTTMGIDNLQLAAKAWPRWFDKVCTRLPGVHSVVSYGDKALLPIRKYDETWEVCFKRTCITTAPEWIRKRSVYAMETLLNKHASHSRQPFPEVEVCKLCKASWKKLAEALYTGDPFKVKFPWLPNAEPSDFRPEDKRRWPKSHLRKRN